MVGMAQIALQEGSPGDQLQTKHGGRGRDLVPGFLRPCLLVASHDRLWPAALQEQHQTPRQPLGLVGGVPNELKRSVQAKHPSSIPHMES